MNEPLGVCNQRWKKSRKKLGKKVEKKVGKKSGEKVEKKSGNEEAINSTRNMIYSLKVFYFLLDRRRYFLFVSQLIYYAC